MTLCDRPLSDFQVPYMAEYNLGAELAVRLLLGNTLAAGQAAHNPEGSEFVFDAGVAQLAEQLFCKQQVIGSIPFAGLSNAVPAINLTI